MFFKSILIFAFTIVSLLGCAGEQDASSQPIQPKIKNTGVCLTQFSAKFHAFVDGQMSAKEVAEFWDCAGDAVREYRKLTSGEHKQDTYSPEAMARFFREYLSLTLDNDLVGSLMEIKRVILAGDSRSLTWAELDLLLEFLNELKAFSLEIRPHTRVLFGERVGVSPVQVDQASYALTKALDRIGIWLRRQNQRYTFNDFRQLVHRLRISMNQGSSQAIALEKIERGITVIKPGKELLMQGSPEYIDGSEWYEFTRLVGLGFKSYLNYQYAFVPGVNQALASEYLPRSLNSTNDLFNFAINRRASRQIPLSELAVIVNRAEEAGWLPTGVTAQATNGFIAWFTKRLLNLGQPTDHLGWSQLALLKSQTDLWMSLLSDPQGSVSFNEIVSASVPLDWDGQGRMVFDRRGAKSWTSKSRRQLVWSYVVLNWMREAYFGEKQNLNHSDVTMVAEEVLPVFKAFGLFKNTEVSIGKRLLRESDVFTHASNGNLEMNMPEAVRYLSFVASAYGSAKVWIDFAQTHCPTLQANCVRSQALREGSPVFNSMPQLQKDIQSKSPEWFIAYMTRAEETILKRVQLEPYNKTDLMQVWMIFQYVETFLRRYDTNLDQIIVVDEGLTAYRVYGPTLMNLLASTGIPQDEILAFFTFMMRYGDTPFTMLGGQILFNHWKWHQNEWAFNADRAILMSILNQLSKF